MCRMLGWSAQVPCSAQDVLGEDLERLRELSNLHEDGWGAAWYAGDTAPQVVREAVPAHESSEFLPMLAEHRASIGIVHLRWATGALARCIENTHPFVRGDVAFIHNGSIPEFDRLRALVDDDLLRTVEGTTDSELYFLAVLSARRRLDSVPAAFAAVIKGLEGCRWPSLNAMWTQSDLLVVCAAEQPEYREPERPEHYFELRWDTRDGVTSAWSQGIRDETASRGTVLPNRHTLAVDRHAGSVRTARLSTHEGSAV
ncbi:MAG: class II glutamine amidotransferase [Candidatus Nanopelagicales bacterium]